MLAIFFLVSCNQIEEQQNSIPNETLTPFSTATVTPTSTPKYWSRWSDLVVFKQMVVLSEFEAWIIGTEGTILHGYPRFFWDTTPYEYSGELNISEGGLSAIDFTSPDDGWMVSYWGEVFHWDGEKWTTLVPYSNLTTLQWYDLEFVDSGLGWMIGCDRKGGFFIPVIRKWNGVSWEDVGLNGIVPNGMCLFDIDVVNSTDAWIIGGEGMPGMAFDIYSGPFVLLHWDGVEWKNIPTQENRLLEQFYGWDKISATSSTDLWILNGQEDTVAHWDGSTWKNYSIPVSFYDETTGARPTIFAVAPDDVWIGGKNLYHWNGDEWIDCNYDIEDNFIVDYETDPEGNVYALTLRGEVLRLWGETGPQY